MVVIDLKIFFRKGHSSAYLQKDMADTQGFRRSSSTSTTHRLILNLLGNAMAYFIPDHFVRNVGYIESFNGKFRDELLNGEIFYTLKEAKMLIERWRMDYNTFRPHSSLNYRPPAPEVYQIRELKHG
jgi:hypothetical protein